MLIPLEQFARPEKHKTLAIQHLENHVVLIVAIISSAAAATLLIRVIISLYIIKKPVKRLTVRASFTALSVRLFTNP